MWKDYPSNPLIKPPGREWIIADPTFLSPDQTPDGRWRLFAHSLRGIHHYASGDGIAWEKQGGFLFSGMRPFLFVDGNRYILFYERFKSPWFSEILARVSDDLIKWSEPQILITPQYRWEGALARNCGNPCMIKTENEYRLYYSAGIVWLPDCGFPEPRYIGLATSEKPLGPFIKQPTPIIWRSSSDKWRNMGAGAIKVIRNPAGKGWIGFNNGIYRDSVGKSRSAIFLLASDDGIEWRYLLDEPILAPTSGWKRALVYALDVRKCGDQWRLYYNARDGWFRGRECIGLATANA